MKERFSREQLRANVISVIAAILTLGPAYAGNAAAELELKQEAVLLKRGELRLPVSLACPKFTIDGVEVGGIALPDTRIDRVEPGKTLEFPFAPIALGDSGQLEVKLHISWSADESIVRKWASYRLGNASKPKLVSEVVLENLDTKAAGLRLLAEQPVNADGVQSRPVFLEGFFAGIEYPVAWCRAEGGRVILTHRPGLRMQPDTWYETRKAVFGIVPAGKEKKGFKGYIETHRPTPKGSHHFIYNPYWSTPTTPSQNQILEIMRIIGGKLYKPYGVTFDSYGLTVFTTDTKSIWEVDKKRFPRGLADLQQACSDIGSHLDIFLSPSSVYPAALDPNWATEQGYETFDYGPIKALCLAGKRYQSQTKKAIVDTVVRYGANHVFVDGYLFDCPASNHGHEPGIMSREAIADGLIDIFAALRKASPEVWLAPTCFSWNASPWWSFYVHSVIGSYGDDAPYGRVPSPVYRESYTSARDYFNLQGAYWLTAPIAATESFGIIQQSDYPFLNDAVTDILRGNMEQHCAINPAYMTDLRWKQLASLMKWARGNAKILQDTEPLLPLSWQNGKCPQVTNDAEMPREPYGYAHWGNDRSLVMLRNPWIEPQTYTVKIPVDAGVALAASGISAVSIYPEARVYGTNMKPGDSLQVMLAPYETVVLSFDKGTPPSAIPVASKTMEQHLKVEVLNREVRLEKFSGNVKVLGADSTCLVGTADSGIRVELDAKVSVDAPESELLILIEDKDAPVDPICKVMVNGKQAVLTSGGSETGWAASSMLKSQRWLFLTTPLPTGNNRVNLDLQTRGGSPVVSAWVWAKKVGFVDGNNLPNTLPQPEVISLDGANLLRPVDAKIASKQTKLTERPAERIDGIFIDAMDSSVVSAPVGGYVKNVCTTKAPMAIAGRCYLRGLGVPAPSKLAVLLDGKYKRFQSWVGLDSANMLNYMDRSAVVFEVWVDGQKLWDSGVVKNVDPAVPVKWVDIDVAGAKLLELAVTAQDTRGHFAQNFADWAEARLLK